MQFVEVGNTPGLIIMNKILSTLQQRGFYHVFSTGDGSICSKDYNIGFDEFDILEIHSMEITSSGQRCTIYAIECDKFNLKGVIINITGTYANAFPVNSISKVLENENLRYQYYMAS